MPGRPSLPAGVLSLALCLLPALRLGAHGDVPGQIEEVTRQIAKEPKNPALYLKRGELYRVHQDWEAALADFRSVARLDPAIDVVELCVGRTLLEAGLASAAKPPLDRYLAAHPADPEALTVRARTLARLGAADASAVDYDRALALAPRPKPDLILERAHVLAGSGAKVRALEGLDEALERLGSLPALELAALDLEVGLSRFDAALSRLGRLESGAARKETWLVRRAEVLTAAGRAEQARAVWEDALCAIEALPSRTRQTRSIAELEERVRSTLSKSPRAE